MVTYSGLKLILNPEADPEKNAINTLLKHRNTRPLACMKDITMIQNLNVGTEILDSL